MTAITATASTPAPLSLPSRNPALYYVEVTPAMVDAVDAYLASKSAQERAELDALIGGMAETRPMRRIA